MASKSQKRICSLILFSLALGPVSALEMSPAMANTGTAKVNTTSSTEHHTVGTSNHHPFLAAVMHGISTFMSHTSSHNSTSAVSASSVHPITPSVAMSAPSTTVSASTSAASVAATSSSASKVWKPITVSVTPRPENQPFVGLNTAEPKHPYLEGFRDVLAVMADALPNPIAHFLEKFTGVPDVIVPPNVPKGAPLWSGMDVRNYSGPIPQTGGVPMKAVDLDPRLMLPDAGQGYRMMYSTTNVEGDPAVSTAEILLPKGSAPKGGWKTIDWAHGTMSLGDIGTPSATDRYDAPYYDHLLKEGYAVIDSDYVGMGTPGTMAYLAAKSEGENVNDAMLAAKKIQGLPLSNIFMLDGHSQGGGAALAAANDVHEKIAGTDLDYRGAIAAAPAPNVAPIAPLVGTGIFNLVKLISPMTAGHALFSIEGVRVNKASGFDMDKYLTPYGKKILDQVAVDSIDVSTDLGKTVDFQKMWTEPTYKIPGFLAAVNKTDQLDTANIKDPTLVTQGFLDGQVPAPFTFLLNIETALRGQKNIQYKYYPFITHMVMNDDGTRSMEDMDKFINQQMGGSGVTPAPAVKAPEVDLIH